MQNFERLKAGQKKISARNTNRAFSVLENLANSSFMNNSFSSNGKVATRNQMASISKGMDIKIFEVQSNATGDGIYICYEQKLITNNWDATDGSPKFEDKDAVEVEILNLDEHDPEAGQHNLVEGTLIAACEITDDEGTKRWVGNPVMDSCLKLFNICTE